MLKNQGQRFKKKVSTSYLLFIPIPFINSCSVYSYFKCTFGLTVKELNVGLNPTSNLIIKKNIFKANQLILHYFQVPALFWRTEKAPRGKKIVKKRKVSFL